MPPFSFWPFWAKKPPLLLPLSFLFISGSLPAPTFYPYYSPQAPPLSPTSSCVSKSPASSLPTRPWPLLAICPSPRHARFLLFFLVWLWLGLGLHLHILALETTLTDRWFYFPQIGLLGIIG